MKRIFGMVCQDLHRRQQLVSQIRDLAPRVRILTGSFSESEASLRALLARPVPYPLCIANVTHIAQAEAIRSRNGLLWHNHIDRQIPFAAEDIWVSTKEDERFYDVEEAWFDLQQHWRKQRSQKH